MYHFWQDAPLDLCLFCSHHISLSAFEYQTSTLQEKDSASQCRLTVNSPQPNLNYSMVFSSSSFRIKYRCPLYLLHKLVHNVRQPLLRQSIVHQSFLQLKVAHLRQMPCGGRQVHHSPVTAEEGEEEDAGPDESQVVGPDGVFRLNRESFGGSTL